MTTTRPSPIAIAPLRAAIKGRVIAPGDDGYDAARTPFYGGRPADCSTRPG